MAHDEPPAVERVPRPAMSAVSPTITVSKTRAIRRHDCRRGEQDCSLHGLGLGYTTWWGFERRDAEARPSPPERTGTLGRGGEFSQIQTSSTFMSRTLGLRPGAVERRFGICWECCELHGVPKEERLRRRGWIYSCSQGEERCD